MAVSHGLGSSCIFYAPILTTRNQSGHTAQRQNQSQHMVVLSRAFPVNLINRHCSTSENQHDKSQPPDKCSHNFYSFWLYGKYNKNKNRCKPKMLLLIIEHSEFL